MLSDRGSWFGSLAGLASGGFQSAARLRGYVASSKFSFELVLCVLGTHGQGSTAASLTVVHRCCACCQHQSSVFETAVYCVQSVTVNLELNRVKATNHGYDDGSDLAGSNPEAIPKGQQLTRFALMYRSFDHKAGR